MTIPRDREARFDPGEGRDQGTVSNKAAYLAPAITPIWRRQWDQVIPFFVFPEAVRKIIDTTNAIESLNSTQPTAIRSRGHFPNDEAAIKLLYLALRGVSRKWKNAQRERTAAMTQFAMMFGDRPTRPRVPGTPQRPPWLYLSPCALCETFGRPNRTNPTSKCATPPIKPAR